VPLYYFVLKTGRDVVPDRDGIILPDESAARHEAIVVARELMRNREVNTRAWRIEVRDDNLWPFFELMFAEIDETILHLPPEFRDSFVIASRRTASLYDAVLDVQRTLAQVRETLTHANKIMATVAENRI
jgi:hypothetical protein